MKMRISSDEKLENLKHSLVGFSPFACRVSFDIECIKRLMTRVFSAYLVVYQVQPQGSRPKGISNITFLQKV